MKRVKTYAEKITSTDSSGLNVVSWKKKCPVCGTEYITTSRSQKFCSASCCKKAQVKKRKQQKEYDKTKEIVRLSSRSHSIANEVIKQLVALGVMEYKCQCGCEENLQIHHVDLNWLNNTPRNLRVVCPKCHAEIHSKLEADLKEQGKTTKDLYDDVENQLFSIILKN